MCGLDTLSCWAAAMSYSSQCPGSQGQTVLCSKCIMLLALLAVILEKIGALCFGCGGAYCQTQGLVLGKHSIAEL